MTQPTPTPPSGARLITAEDQPVFPCWLYSKPCWEHYETDPRTPPIGSFWFTHWHADQPEAPTCVPAATPAAGDKIAGLGFYRDAAPGTFGPNEWLDLLMACQDGRATCMRVMEYIERETVPVRLAKDSEALLDAMTNTFLRWPLPASVSADLCATDANCPNRSGTNLLTFVEAKQMIREVVFPLMARQPVPSANEARGDGGTAILQSSHEAYPKNWKHCIIHLNPATGEMHSDGDHSVREWIQARLMVANEARGAEQLLIELIATKQVLEEFKQVRVKEMCALLNMEMSATNTRLRDGIKLIHEWAAGASGFGMPSDPNERLDEIDKLCARLKVIAGITTESPRDQITRESFENEGKEHGEPQS